MKRLKETPLLLITAIMLFGLFACSPTQAADTNDVASTIAEFDLPAGYSPEFSTSMLGYSVASYKGPTGPSHLYLIQSEKASDGDELAKMIQELVPGSTNPDAGMTVIENRPVTVRDQEATMLISEGISSEKVSYRQASVLFVGKGGPALLVLSDATEAWDQEAVKAFLASIH
jgi:hypothetical protein